jgi:protocatechuate 3,4-dioxygenase beta subunit
MRFSLPAAVAVVLLAAPAVADDDEPRRTIAGTVVDGEGAPVDGARLGVAWIEGAPPAALTIPAVQELMGNEIFEMTKGVETTTTGTDGRFAIDIPKGRSIGISVLAEGFAPFRVFPVSYAEGTVIRLGRGATGRVRVMDAAGREPIAGARVVAREGMPWRGRDQGGRGAALGHEVEAVSDDRGRATLEALGNGYYVVDVEAPGRVSVHGRLLRAGTSLGVRTIRAAALTGTVRNEAGEPVAGVGITAGAVFAAGRDPNEPVQGFFFGRAVDASVVRREARTDAEGRFRIEGLPPETDFKMAALVVGGPGIRVEGKSAAAGEEGILDVTLPSTREVTVTLVDTDGRPVHGARGSLSPRCPDDEPPPDRWMRFDPDLARDERAALVLEESVADPALESLGETSGEDGRVAFAARAPRCHTLSWSGEGFLSGERVIEVPDAAPVDLGEIELARAGAISGRVVDFDGAPVPRLRVGATKVRPEEGEGAENAPEWAMRNSPTDTSGRFEIDGLEEGNYRLEVVSERRWGEELPWTADPLPPTPRGTRDVEIRLRGAGVLDGRVVDALNGEPLAGAWAVVTETKSGGVLGALFGGADEGPPRQTNTPVGDDGRFRLGLAGARYRVQIRKSGYLPATTSVTISVDEVARLEDVAIERGATIRGVVLSPQDVPLAGARVGLADDAPFSLAAFEQLGAFGEDSPPSLASTVSDMAGDFTLTGVPAGTVRLRVYHTECAPLDETLHDLAPGEVREGVVLRTHDGGAVEGVLTGKGGRPIPRALVAAASLQDVQGARVITTDERGRFRLDRLPQGQHYVVAVPSGKPEDMTLPRQIDVQPGLVTRARLTSGGGISVEGRVLLAGAPLARAQLGFARVGSPFGGTPKAPVTGEDGSYRTLLLSPGEYIVAVRAEEPAINVSRTLTVPAEGGALPDLVVSAPASLEVEVLGPDGGPVVGAEISLFPGEALTLLDPLSRGTVKSDRTTDEEGLARFAGIGPGRHRLWVRAEGLGSSLAVARVREGDDEASVSVELPGHRTVHGSVFNDEGRPVRQAVLVMIEEGGEAVSLEKPWTTDAGGLFELSGAPDREMILAVAANAYGLALVPLDRGEDDLEITLARAGGADVLLEGSSGGGVDAVLGIETASGMHLAPGALAGVQFLLGGTTTPDAEGWVRLRGLEPGRYTLTAFRGGREAGSTSLTIRSDEIVDERLRVRR